MQLALLRDVFSSGSTWASPRRFSNCSHLGVTLTELRHDDVLDAGAVSCAPATSKRWKPASMVDEIESSCPNKHHFLSDLSFAAWTIPIGFYAANRPYGLIEATISRAGASSAEGASMGIAGFY
jgi:hypothetical protein